MKKLIYLFIVIQTNICGQGLFNFENDSLTSWIQFPAERWERSSDNPLEGQYSLHHSFDNVSAGVDYTGFYHENADSSNILSFSFRIRHGYNPSASNNWQCFFLADHFPETRESSIRSGIFFGVNLKGSDDIVKLWQSIDGSLIEICNTGLNYQELIGTEGRPVFHISRAVSGEWEVRYSLEGKMEDLISIGKGMEESFCTGKLAGFRYSYSSAQDQKLWIDEVRIEGRFFRDTLAPFVQTLAIEGMSSLRITFNETILADENSSFNSGINVLDSLHFREDHVFLYFHNSFKNRKEEQLYISHVVDTEGNVLTDTLIIFRLELATFGELVINEIMPDPEPVVYLPDCEYIELFNRSDLFLALSGWTLAVNGKKYPFGATGIGPGEFLILTSEKCHTDFETARTLKLFTSETFLPNSGGIIELFDHYERLIHYVEYDEMERYDTYKSDGGWSLERIDPSNLCGGIENWAVSIDWKGGTPGENNSVLEVVNDFNAPEFVFIGLSEEEQIILNFDEPLFLTDEVLTQIEIEGLPSTFTLESDYLVSEKICLIPTDTMVENLIYTLLIDEIKDCAGNTMRSIQREFKIPIKPLKNELLINEIMYDPTEGGNEYIELYNCGSEYIDLSDLKLAVGESPDPFSSSFFLCGEKHLFPPKSFVILSKYPEALEEEWTLKKGMDIIEVEEWKALPNSGACIQLKDRSESFIDLVCYDDSMHNAMISVTSGIALERISASPCNIGDCCWTSAAASVNFGTPGMENSQFQAERTHSNDFLLEPQVFSPDGDAFEDVLNIILPEGLQGKLIDVFITDISGTMIRYLIARGNAGGSDRFFWDGFDDSGKNVLPGIYIVHVQISGLEGLRRYRKACALRYR